RFKPSNDCFGLLLYACSQGINLPLLQSNRCLQFLHHALLFEQLVCRERRARRGNAELATCIYNNRVTADWHTRDVADVAPVAHVCTKDASADTDNVVGRDDVGARKGTNGYVIRTVGDTTPGRVTYSHVAITGDTSIERVKTDGRVAAAFGIALERQGANGRVFEALSVKRERPGANGRVVLGIAHSACVIFEERALTNGSVAHPGHVAEERLVTNRRVATAVGIELERLGAISGVGVAGRIAEE